jgi:DNA repair ATPase RecN
MVRHDSHKLYRYPNGSAMVELKMELPNLPNVDIESYRKRIDEVINNLQSGQKWQEHETRLIQCQAEIDACQRDVERLEMEISESLTTNTLTDEEEDLDKVRRKIDTLKQRAKKLSEITMTTKRQFNTEAENSLQRLNNEVQDELTKEVNKNIRSLESDQNALIQLIHAEDLLQAVSSEIWRKREIYRSQL